MGELIQGKFGASRAEALYRQGCVLDESPDTLRQAETAYREALHWDPEHVGSMVNLGNLHVRTGERKAGTKLYRAALKLQPGHPEAAYNLGYLAYQDGKIPTAIKLFRKALQSDPEFADAHFNLAMALKDLGQTVEARPHWRRYLQLDANSEWATIAEHNLGYPKLRAV